MWVLAWWYLCFRGGPLPVCWRPCFRVLRCAAWACLPRSVLLQPWIILSLPVYRMQCNKLFIACDACKVGRQGGAGRRQYNQPGCCCWRHMLQAPSHAPATRHRTNRPSTSLPAHPALPRPCAADQVQRLLLRGVHGGAAPAAPRKDARPVRQLESVHRRRGCARTACSARTAGPAPLWRHLADPWPVAPPLLAAPAQAAMCLGHDTCLPCPIIQGALPHQVPPAYFSTPARHSLLRPAEAAEANQIIAAGRGEGRISRRRKRQQALRQRELGKRALKVGVWLLCLGSFAVCSDFCCALSCCVACRASLPAMCAPRVGAAPQISRPSFFPAATPLKPCCRPSIAGAAAAACQGSHVHPAAADG